jgi:hypothetical protein
LKGEIMPRALHAPLPQPIYHEPVFDEGVSSPDPVGFLRPHPSDTQVYKEVQALLKKDVVAFDPSRGLPSDLFVC